MCSKSNCVRGITRCHHYWKFSTWIVVVSWLCDYTCNTSRQSGWSAVIIRPYLICLHCTTHGTQCTLHYSCLLSNNSSVWSWCCIFNNKEHTYLEYKYILANRQHFILIFFFYFYYFCTTSVKLSMFWSPHLCSAYSAFHTWYTKYTYHGALYICHVHTVTVQPHFYWTTNWFTN